MQTRKITILLCLAVMLMMAAMMSGTSPTQAATSGLFISEYVEGSSNNKAIEIYNGTGAAVDLGAGGYNIKMYFNGSTSAGTTVNLTGTVADGDVYVVAHASANATILAQADQTTGSSFYNGDDAVVLSNSSGVVDAIGQVGFDPGSQWGSGLVSTQDNTLRRQTAVCEGDSVETDAFDPSVEWDGFAQDTFDGLGSHTDSCVTLADDLFISEYIEGSSNNKAIEIYNGTGAPVDLAAGGYTISMYFNGATSAGTNIALTGTIADGDVFVLAHSSANATILAQADQTSGSSFYNGDDAIVLSKTGGNVDVIGQVGFDPGSEWGTGNISTQNNTIRRQSPFCVGDTDETDAYDPATEWDGFAQDTVDGLGSHTADCSGGGGSATPTPIPTSVGTPIPTPTLPAGANCGDPATLIHTIQGTGLQSGMNGATGVTIEGVVLTDFQDTGLNGFHVQEEDSDADANATTSEGIFVYEGASSVVVNAGDVVRVTGDVTEFETSTGSGAYLTEITNVTSVTVCSSGASVTPVTVSFPVSDLNDWEAYESMLVNIPQTLTVSGNYTLGRYGSVDLSNGRLYQPTNIVAPGSAAATQLDLNNRNRILLDDGDTVQNSDPVLYPAPGGLSASNTLRSGDTVTGLTAVLEQRFSNYQLQPAGIINFTHSNARTAVPAAVGGSLKVTSFNVLNYFNGDGSGGGFPTARGADTATEFTRQRDKIIAAMVAIDADIYGLMEIENDGYGSNSAIQDLVNGLNDGNVTRYI